MATPAARTVTTTVGANVRAELSRRGHNQAALAEVLGITQSGVSKRLRGVTPFDVDELAAVSTWLGVPLGVLLDGAVPEKAPA